MTSVYVINFGRKYFYLQWTDPETGRKITKSSKCTSRRDAERVAISIERDFERSSGVISSNLSWESFADRYEFEHLNSLAERSKMKAFSVLNTYERFMKPAFLKSVTTATISQYASLLRSNGRSESTIATHLRTLRAALSWACHRRFIASVPAIPKIVKREDGRNTHGRPITILEFLRMIRVTRQVMPDWRPWVRLQRGIWLSGLRLGEAMKLRWRLGNWPSVDLSGPGWLVIPAGQDKSRRYSKTPLTPDFLVWLKRHKHRGEFVLNPGCDENRASKVISAIGEIAGVETDPVTGRTATAHDLRRSFAQRWASKLSPVDLQRLMRHSSINTTLGFYLDADSEGLASRLANSFANTLQKK